MSAILQVNDLVRDPGDETELGTFIKTEGQASGLSIMFGMVFALMSGC